MRKEKRKSATARLAAAALLTCCLVQTTDCYRLTKTEKRQEADTATRIGVTEGTIVFGKDVQTGSGLESYVVDGTRRASSNGSVEDETSYQADATGWDKGPQYHYGSKEAEWNILSPTLHCLKDQMKFRAVGPAAAQLLLHPGNVPPIPLSHVPSSCGYTVQKNSMALVVAIPYNGCYVNQKGGSYVVPLQFKGHPVSLSCPKPAHTTYAPQYIVPANIKVPPFHYLPSYSKYPVVVAHPASYSELHKYPQYHYYFPPHHQYFPHPTKPHVPHIPVLPQYPPFPHPQYPKNPVLDLTTIKVPVDPTVTLPHQYDQLHGLPHYPHGIPHYHLHGYPHGPLHGYPHGHPHFPPHGHPHFPPPGHSHNHPPHQPHGQKHQSHGDHIQLPKYPLT